MNSTLSLLATFFSCSHVDNVRTLSATYFCLEMTHAVEDFHLYYFNEVTER